MLTVNIHEAKTRLSELIARAVKGEPFIIAKAGKPMVKVEALAPEVPDTSRRIGAMAGMFTIPDDFNTMFQEEIEDLFYNGPLFPPGSDASNQDEDGTDHLPR